ncbi:MAG: hypothetical protein LKI78_03715 [Bifidobacterium tibiigranuli]|nr:hypothetical protein [Bifidobacterium tibiigranuli]
MKQVDLSRSIRRVLGNESVRLSKEARWLLAYMLLEYASGGHYSKLELWSSRGFAKLHDVPIRFVVNAFGELEQQNYFITKQSGEKGVRTWVALHPNAIALLEETEGESK